MLEQPRLFLSYSFDNSIKHIVDAFKEVAGQAQFEVVTGDPPGLRTPPELVRSRILSCDCFAALLTSTDDRRNASPWVYNEIGMAFVLGLPLLILKEQTVEDPGLVEYATSYQGFDRSNLLDFKSLLTIFLRQLKKDVQILLKSPNTLGNFISNLAADAICGRTQDSHEQSAALTRLNEIVPPIVAETRLRWFSFGESDEFTAKWRSHLPEKRAIAKYVFDEMLRQFANQPEASEPLTWVFMDSGSVTYTICEEIVNHAARIPVVTNNLASCRIFSSIGAYPCFIVPGELESRYVAAVGEQCIKFLTKTLTANRQKMVSIRIQLAVLAATSLTSNTGVCGNDPRHNKLKRTLLELCPSSLVVFEGEKLLEPGGSPIFDSPKNWKACADNCKEENRSIRFVTHMPEEFDLKSNAQQVMFHSEISRLRDLFGRQAVVVLPVKNEKSNEQTAPRHKFTKRVARNPPD